MTTISNNPESTNFDKIDIFMIFIKSILFVKNHSKTLLITLGIVLIVGLGLFLLPKKNYFRAYLVADTSLSDEDVFEVVKSIKYSVMQKEFSAIEHKLQLPKEDSSRLSDINIDNVLIAADWNSRGEAMTLVKSTLFKITIDFKGTARFQNAKEQVPFLDTIQKGIVDYINNNPYIKERQKYSKIAISNMILEIENQLKKLDTLQKSVIDQKPQRGQVVVENANKQSFSSDILTLLERKLRLEESYQLDKPIMIVEDFNCTSVVESRISTLSITLICFGIFIIGLLFAVFQEMKPMILYETNKRSIKII